MILTTLPEMWRYQTAVEAATLRLRTSPGWEKARGKFKPAPPDKCADKHLVILPVRHEHGRCRRERHGDHALQAAMSMGLGTEAAFHRPQMRHSPGADKNPASTAEKARSTHVARSPGKPLSWLHRMDLGGDKAQVQRSGNREGAHLSLRA